MQSKGSSQKLAKQRLKRGVFRGVVDLQAAINRFVAETNHDPKPFTWTADPDKIIAAARCGHQVLDSSRSQQAPAVDVAIKTLIILVGGTGIEPVTPSMSRKCSSAELTARSSVWKARVYRRAARGVKSAVDTWIRISPNSLRISAT